MIKLNNIPPPAKKLTFDLLGADSIVILIESALKNEHGAIAQGIRNCIEHKTPSWKIIKEVQEMAEDNYMLVSNILGGALTDQIVNF